MARRSGSDRWRRRRSLKEVIRGPEGAAAELLVERDGVTREVTLAFSRRFVRPPLRQAIEELEHDIYYVDLSQAAWEQLAPELDALASAAGIVFDLRGYPNGNHAILRHLTDEPILSAHWNVPLQIYPDGHDREWFKPTRWELKPAEPRLAGEIVFLTGGGAISYAESVMAIVAHYDLGEIVGEATAGANGNINPFSLPGDFRITWTGMRVVNHDGSQHHLVGVRPTISARPTLAGLRAGRDEVLERGLEVLRAALEQSP